MRKRKSSQELRRVPSIYCHGYGGHPSCWVKLLEFRPRNSCGRGGGTAGNSSCCCVRVGGSAPVHRTLWWCIQRWRPWYDIVATVAGTTKVDMWRSRGSTPARALAWRLHPLPAAALKVATPLLSALSAIMAAPSHAVLDAIFSNSKSLHFFGICWD